MREKIETLLKPITEAVVRLFNPKAIVLFGSYAREDFTAQSDIDLMIIVDEPFLSDKERFHLMTSLWKSLKSFHISKDILVFSQQEVDQWRGSKNHVIGRAFREGKILYERN